MSRKRIAAFGWLWLFLVPSAPAQRIVSLAPNLTEIVCELGLGDNLVGVTDYCLFPDFVKDLPKVGGYLDPNLETIVGMKPDLVLALPEHQTTILKLRKLGVRVETIRNWNIDDIHRSVERVGRLTGREKEAGAVLARLDARRDQLVKTRKRVPKCLLVLGHEAGDNAIKEVYIVGRNGFLNELVEMAGGMNVYHQEKPYYPRLTQESLFQLDPDVIIDLVPVDERTTGEIERKRRAWQSVPHLKAIRTGQYHIIHQEHVLQAGPRYLDTLAELVAILDGL